MLRSLIFVIFVILTTLCLHAAPAEAVPNTWLGLGAGADHHLMVDFGVPMVHSGAAAWGCEVGYVGLNNSDQTASYVQPGQTRETDFQGLQFGGFSDWGRGYACLGVERVQRSTITNQAIYLPNIHDPVANTVPSDTTSLGPYAKLGYRVTPMISIYVSVGTATKVLGGVGFHF